MDLTLIARVLCLVSFLIFGIRTMRNALESSGDGLFTKALAQCTKNDVFAVLSGTLVTALVQSSAAITVTVVGLADAKKLPLRSAIGVILGANVGTCVTGWITGLAGINGAAAIFSAYNIAGIAAAAGIVLLTATGKKNAGNALIGFALTISSVSSLSRTLEPLSRLEGFKTAFTLFENPLAGIVIGALVTAILQSSAASIGILQAACAGGGVTLAAAVPVILGQNIGTTVTALIASAGASISAKRAAFIHFFVNLLGAAVFMVIFFSLRFSSLGAAFSRPVDAAGIAGFHTWFNVLSTLVMIPFIPVLEKAALGIGRSEEEA